MTQPLYAQLFEKILDRIANGELAPGAMLPSEIELARQFGVSQGTARKAVMMLEQEKIVDRIQGRGTFVIARTPESALFYFFKLRSIGGEREAPALIRETVRRRDALAAETKTLYGAPEHVFEIERVRAMGGRNVIFERSSVPVALFPGLLERAPLPNTLYVFYQQVYSSVVIQADEEIRAVALAADIAEILELPAGAPMLEVVRVAYDLRRRAIERRVSLSSTAHHAYAISLS